jgi:hypothetical protein
MSKLQKSAWLSLVVITITSMFSILCFVLAMSRIEKGFNYVNVILFLMMISIIVPAALIAYKKKSYAADFDEREKFIEQRANTMSISILIVFLCLACFIPLLGFGAGNSIKVIYLPIIFWGTLFTYQLTKSMAIIIQCIMEEENG